VCVHHFRTYDDGVPQRGRPGIVVSAHPLYPGEPAASTERQALVAAALREVALARTTDVSLRPVAKSAGQSKRVARRELGDVDLLIIETATLTARDALVTGESRSFSNISKAPRPPAEVFN
jgi:hypothetical protein